MTRLARVTRRPVALWTAAALVLGTVVGFYAFGRGAPAVAFQQAGHWVYNSPLGAVFRVDGGGKTVDAEVAGVQAEPGSPVLQGSSNGYVVGSDKVMVVWPYARQSIAGQAAAVLSKPGSLLDVDGGRLAATWSARGLRIGAEGLVQAWNSNENFQVRDRSKKLQQRFSGLPLPVDTLFTIHQTLGLHQRWERLNKISSDVAGIDKLD